MLVDMSFKEAWIKRHLEWRAGAKLPNDKQANHILFGKNPKDSTSMVHAYKEKKPVFSITRLLDKDTQLIQVSEGEILIETKENEK